MNTSDNHKFYLNEAIFSATDRLERGTVVAVCDPFKNYTDVINWQGNEPIIIKDVFIGKLQKQHPEGD